jgi:hypothetical protein
MSATISYDSKSKLWPKIAIRILSKRPKLKINTQYLFGIKISEILEDLKYKLNKNHRLKRMFVSNIANRNRPVIIPSASPMKCSNNFANPLKRTIEIKAYI